MGYGGSFTDCFPMPGCYAIPVRRFSEVLGKNAIVLSTGNYFPCLILYLSLGELGVNMEDVMRAKATEMAVSPRQLSMSEMMAMASEAGNNISEGVKKK